VFPRTNRPKTPLCPPHSNKMSANPRTVHIVQRKLQYAPRPNCRHYLALVAALAPANVPALDKDWIGKHKPRGQTNQTKAQWLRH